MKNSINDEVKKFGTVDMLTRQNDA